MREVWCECDGARLFAVEQGAGPAVLLFHGGGANHHAGLGLATQLAERYRVITPDLRGSGRSWDGRSPSWDRLADDVVALDHLGLQRAVVGGPSMGAATALRCALRHPDRVSALVMITPAYGGEAVGLSDFQRLSFRRMSEMAAQALKRGIEALRPMYQASPAMEAYFDAVSAGLDPASFAATAALMVSGAQPFGLAAELAAITAPTLLIPGDDPMHPAAVSALLAANIPGCVTRPRPEGLAAAEADKATARLIDDFLTDVLGRATRQQQAS